MNVRICDLGLKIEGTLLEKRIDRLYEELEQRQLAFRPHCWLSEEWFCPDGVPGIAIPFYLAHPRLVRLERAQMLEVEGGTEEWCMRILRHEAGHAIDNAFNLHRKRSWTGMFGKYSVPYPDRYQPKPYSKSYVLHLDPWYAQSHPSEDYSETFAVWLKPRSRWRTQYAGWPVLRKLEYVDGLMRLVRRQEPLVRSTRIVEPVYKIRKTLGEHYEQKRARYKTVRPSAFDRDLLRLFSNAPEHARQKTAAGFLRRVRPELRHAVARWTGEYQYTIDQVLNEMIDRCRELKLRLVRTESETRQDALVVLTVQTMNYLHSGRHRYAL